MITTKFFVAGLVTGASATSLVAREDMYFFSLLRRQEPGTPTYSCHNSCGSAVTLSRGGDPCSDIAFISNYNNCLKCSGPDNYNIWRYYGGTLSSAGSKCGFDTEPLPGKQENASVTGNTGAYSSLTPIQSPVAPYSSYTTATSSSQVAATTGAATNMSSTNTNASAISTASAPAEFTASVATSLVVTGFVIKFGTILMSALFGMWAT